MHINFSFNSAVLLAATPAIISSILQPVLAAPTNSYPLALQLPPLIQVGKSYSYQLPQDTFTSQSKSNVTYSADGLPEWLSFDSDSRTFSGTAPDSVSAPSSIWFDLVGTDSSGVTSVNSTLAITNLEIATLSSSVSLTSELKQAGPLADSNTLILTPNTEFSIYFDKSIFNSSFPIIQYSALTSSHSPLPSWITFDSNSFSFSGIAPAVNSNIAPSNNFPLTLLAVQIPGFSSVGAQFNLLLGSHQFSTNITYANISAAQGEDFVYNIPLDKMLLDKSPVYVSNISSISISPSSNWLSVNSSAAALEGKVPNSFQGGSFNITVTNTFSDSVQIALNLVVKETPTTATGSTDTSNDNNTIFTLSSLPAVNATTLDYFMYTLPSSVVNSTNFTVLYDPPAPWITFYKTNLTFVGEVPSGFSGTTVTLVNDVNNNDNLSLTIRSAVASSSTTSPTSIPSSTSVAQPTKSTNKTVAIVCGVVIPVVTILALILLFFCCRRRRRNNTPGPVSNPILPDHVITNSPVIEKQPSLMTLNLPTDPSTPILTSQHWDSPVQATEFNMFKLDNPKVLHRSNSCSEGDSETTHVGDLPVTPVTPKFDTSNILASINAPSFPPSPPPVIPPRASQRDEEILYPAGKPRNSWRQTTDPALRWHSRTQGGSLATIATDELVSVRMVEEGPTSEIPAQLPRGNSSPNLRPIGDGDSDYGDSNYDLSGNKRASRHTAHSASIGSYTSSESDSVVHQKYGPTIPYASGSNLGAIAESPNPGSILATMSASEDSNNNTSVEKQHGQQHSGSQSSSIYGSDTMSEPDEWQWPNSVSTSQQARQGKP